MSKQLNEKPYSFLSKIGNLAKRTIGTSAMKNKAEGEKETIDKTEELINNYERWLGSAKQNPNVSSLYRFLDGQGFYHREIVKAITQAKVDPKDSMSKNKYEDVIKNAVLQQMDDEVQFNKGLNNPKGIQEIPKQELPKEPEVKREPLPSVKLELMTAAQNGISPELIKKISDDRELKMALQMLLAKSKAKGLIVGK